MPSESIQNTCPLCQSRILFRFPQDFPKLSEVEALYCHAVLHASGDRKRLSMKVLGIGYRAMMARVNEPLPNLARRPMNSDQIAAALDSLEHSNHLVPVGSPGVCSGTFAKVAGNELATIYDVRFNDGPTGVGQREDVDAGGRPKVLFVEADGTERVFEFGDSCQDDMTVFIIPVRPQHCMAVAIKTEFDE